MLHTHLQQVLQLLVLVGQQFGIHVPLGEQLPLLRIAACRVDDVQVTSRVNFHLSHTVACSVERA